MNKQYRQGIITVIIVAILMLLGIATGQLSKRTSQDTIPTPSTQEQTQTISYDGQDGKNALELLQQNHKVETIDTSFGTFVKSIDGVTSKDNSAWIFYIDGKIGEVAADKATTQNGQKIEWRYESF